jgi:hypothetical protein
LGLDVPLRVRRIEERHRGYLAWHRRILFSRGDERVAQPNDGSITTDDGASS